MLHVEHDEELAGHFMAPNNNKPAPLPHALGSLPFLVFFCFVCYALSASNIPEVKTACGPELWQFVLAHLVVPMGLVIVVVVVPACIMAGCVQDETLMPIVFGVVGGVLCLLHSCLFLGLGLPIVAKAMQSDVCVSALSSASFTHTPLLGILGCVYLAMDGLVLLVLVIALLCGCCLGLAPSSRSPY